VSNLFEFDLNMLARSKRDLVGVDEVGRGCLAGPVVAAAAVIDYKKFTELPEAIKSLFIDSKKLSPKKRQLALENMGSFLKGHFIAEVDAKEVDRLNILWASLKAMYLAVNKVSPECIEPLVLVDGNRKIPKLTIHQQTVVKGDSKSLCIAVASILAKEHRDQLMKQMDITYPGYEFAKHVGYGTKLHKECLERLGPCQIHRKTFAPVRKLLDIHNLSTSHP